jgi:hypothetical protein
MAVTFAQGRSTGDLRETEMLAQDHGNPAAEPGQ